MTDTVSEGEIRDSFARQALMQTFEVRMDTIGDGHCELTAPILTKATQQHGAAADNQCGEHWSSYSKTERQRPLVYQILKRITLKIYSC